jgi:membrane-bound hydrogenase subunit alpha
MSKIVIPIGPQHPALKEPACFSIALTGEKVVEANVRLGYNHRGIEKACEMRTYIQDIYILERICGICSHSHATCFCQAVEELAGVDISRRAKYIRTLVAELERIHSHLLWLGVAGHEIGFDTLFMYTWRDRELSLDLLASIGGNRINYGINTIGGVRRDISPQQVEDVRKAVDILEERTKYYIELALEEPTLAARLGGVGTLNKEDAIRFNAVGPVVRAAGIPRDIRKDDPYLVYDEIPFNVITDDHADVFGRTVVRVLELMECYKIVRFILDNLPDGEIQVKVPRRIPAGEVVSRYEAPRGEDVHFVKSNGTEKPDRVRVRAPSAANWAGISHMLEGDYLADVPIIIAAIDPCYSCTDRSIVINDLERRKGSIMDWPSLVEYSIKWYKERGMNFGRVKISREGW